MIPRNTGKRQEEIKLMMTPMIDVVFLLLIFFVMTFKIVKVEGDFNIRMPASSQSARSSRDMQLSKVYRVYLTANAEGELAGIYFGEKSEKDRLKSFTQLHQKILGLVGNDTGPGSAAENMEVELHCAKNLKFRYTIDAMSAISGKISDGQIVKLIENIKLFPPKG